MKRIKFKKGSKLKEFLDTSGEVQCRKKIYEGHLRIAKKKRQARRIIAKKIRKNKDIMFEKAKKIGII